MPFCLVFRVHRSNAGFLAAFGGQRHLCLGEAGVGLLVVVPQLEQQLPLFHLVAFLDGEDFDAAAHDGGQLGALAGFDGAGTGIGERGFDFAGADFADDDGQRLGTGNPEQAAGKNGNDDDDEGKAAHGGFLTESRQPAGLGVP